jgi:hypothetical protein
VLQNDDVLPIAIDDDGNALVSVVDGDNGDKSRGLFGRFGQQKMDVSATDTSTQVVADTGARLVFSGDPSSGEIVITEVPGENAIAAGLELPQSRPSSGKGPRELVLIGRREAIGARQ